MEVVTEFFENSVICKNKWPSRSPDLSLADFFLWVFLKNNIYRNKPRTTRIIPELRDETEPSSQIDRPKHEPNGGGQFQHQL